MVLWTQGVAHIEQLCILLQHVFNCSYLFINSFDEHAIKYLFHS